MEYTTTSAVFLGALDRPEDDLQSVGQPEPLDAALGRGRVAAGSESSAAGCGAGGAAAASCGTDRAAAGATSARTPVVARAAATRAAAASWIFERIMERSTPFVSAAAPAEDAPAAIACPAASRRRGPERQAHQLDGHGVRGLGGERRGQQAPRRARPRAGPAATGAVAAPRQPALDRADRAAELRRGLLVRLALEVAEDHRGPVPRRQPLELVVDRRAQLLTPPAGPIGLDPTRCPRPVPPRDPGPLAGVVAAGR